MEELVSLGTKSMDYTLDNPLVSALIRKTAETEKELRRARKKAARAVQAAEAAAAATQMEYHASPPVRHRDRRRGYGDGIDKKDGVRGHRSRRSRGRRESSRGHRRSKSPSQDNHFEDGDDSDVSKKLRLMKLEKDTRELELELLRLKKQREQREMDERRRRIRKRGGRSSRQFDLDAYDNVAASTDDNASIDSLGNGGRVRAVDDDRLAAGRRRHRTEVPDKELIQTIIAKESEATKLRLDVSALESRAVAASEESAAARKEAEELRTLLRHSEKKFEQRQGDLTQQAKAYKKMVADMHKVLLSAEKKRARCVHAATEPLRCSLSRRSTLLTVGLHVIVNSELQELKLKYAKLQSKLKDVAQHQACIIDDRRFRTHFLLSYYATMLAAVLFLMI